MTEKQLDHAPGEGLQASDRLLKAYLGHEAGDMLGGHYRRIDLEELRAVSDLIEGWRDGLKASPAWQGSVNNRVSACVGV